MPDALCSGQQIVADWQERIAVLTEDLGPKMIADEQLTQFNDLLVELIERTRRP
jgi:hypothetical protein